MLFNAPFDAGTQIAPGVIFLVLQLCVTLYLQFWVCDTCIAREEDVGIRPHSHKLSLAVTGGDWLSPAVTGVDMR